MGTAPRTFRRICITTALAGLCHVSACRYFTEPDPWFPASAIPLDPIPDRYPDLWSDTERCSGLHGTLASVHFYVVPHVTSWQVGNKSVLGVWEKHGNRIILAEFTVDFDIVVRHEMLHALLGRGDHPREYFVVRCGELVGGTGFGP